MDPNEVEDFPWHLGVYDAHCHPTDINASVDKIPSMRAKILTLMASREHDQEMVHVAAEKFGSALSANGQDKTRDESSARVIPGFGWHPWFSYLLFDDVTEFPGKTELDEHDKQKHYANVLYPPPEDDSFANAPEQLVPLSKMLKQQRKYLEQHPLALVGEVGIDKAFRIPQPWFPTQFRARTMLRTSGSREGRPLAPQRVTMEHQRKVLEVQLRLAGEMQRAVSVHGVQAHGTLYTIFADLWQGFEKQGKRARKRNQEARGVIIPGQDDHRLLPFPPRVCLHSYSGSVQNLTQYYASTVPIDVYVSFSIGINLPAGSSDKVEQVIKWLPEDRILIESDFHEAGEDMDNMLEQATRKICALRQWTLPNGLARLAKNYKRFVLGLDEDNVLLR